nr:hypothetical protein [uncultured Campylobacter sp.]
MIYKGPAMLNSRIPKKNSRIPRPKSRIPYKLTQNSAPNTTTPKSLPQYAVSTRSMISFRFISFWLAIFMVNTRF